VTQSNDRFFAPEFDNTPVSRERPRFTYIPQRVSQTPVVSLVTPYYNTGEIFLQTVQSVLQQSLQDWEWLIINDGSDKVEALKVLEDLRERDPRIRVIDLSRSKGPASARNVGIQHARGEFLFFLDSDDLIEPTALEKMAWLLESHPEFSFCKGFTVSFGEQRYLAVSGFEAGDLFLSRNPITITAMVRRNVALAVGGFDATLTQGLEDWDFWLRCATHGYWGWTIPEYLDWYRRRSDHSERWQSWSRRGITEMRRKLRRRYPQLYATGIPEIAPMPLKPYETVRDEMPFDNVLQKEKPRLLMILPWLAMGGADKFNLDLIVQMKAREYDVTIATTVGQRSSYQWYRHFAALTPDIFILPHFLRVSDYPRFLQYLIRSRQIDLVMVSNSELGYKLLPYLRARHPDVTFVDYCHMEEEYWNNGGHPRASVGYQDVLDLNIVASEHLKRWMTGRGADANQIEVCYINVDTKRFAPNQEVRQRTRAELGVGSDTPLILYAGRLCDQKQPKVFAEVMRELRARGLDFACLVAGDGDYKKWLSRFLHRHFLTRHVHMLGRVSNERIRKLLSAADIFFLPSKMEGISLALYEAMAMGVVPVSADVGGQRELVSPDSGILVQRGAMAHEVTAYADALEKLIRNPDMRAVMGRAARARVCAHFSIEKMGDRMEALFQVARQRHLSAVKPRISLGLSLEQAVEAVEYERLSSASAPLWKYSRVESAWWGLHGVASLVMLKLGWPVLHILKPAKDILWIAGHRAKIMVLHRLGKARDDK